MKTLYMYFVDRSPNLETREEKAEEIERTLSRLEKAKEDMRGTLTAMTLRDLLLTPNKHCVWDYWTEWSKDGDGNNICRIGMAYASGIRGTGLFAGNVNRDRLVKFAEEHGADYVELENENRFIAFNTEKTVNNVGV